MPIVKVNITSKDHYVGAMVRALAVEVGGFPSVKGQKDEYLDNKGSYFFSFRRDESAVNFCNVVRAYIPGILARAEDPIGFLNPKS
jgi:hypothetical protein